jgi:CRISPR system Cascade subunit CasD
MTEETKHTLLLRLAGPLQSWGTTSRYTERDTGMEPSKSGVVGILAASLGRSRGENVGDLATLRMGVRVDQEGVPGYDFQTAGAGDDQPGIAMARDDAQAIARRFQELNSGTLKDSARGKSSISRRHLLFDAMFLVGLEGEDLRALHRLDAALHRPVYPIGLGRRSYIPSVPVAIPGGGVRQGASLEDALRQEPWPVAPTSRRAFRSGSRTPERRFILEAFAGQGTATRNDQPVEAAFVSRIFGPRSVTYATYPVTVMKEESDATL